MRSKQAGVTLIGWVFLLLPMALCVYVGMRLAPVYLNYMKVARTLEQAKAEMHGSDSLVMVRANVEKHLDVESVDYPGINDIKFKRDGRSWVIQASYDDQAPLFSNIFILVVFDKTVTLGGGASE